MRLFRRFLYAFLRLIVGIFYERKYLHGKYFTNEGLGWGWVAKGIWQQKVLRFNRHLPFPASPFIRISNYKNLILGENNLNNFQSFGIYFQNFDANIVIGNNVYIAPNVGIITSNHNIKDIDSHSKGKQVEIGDNCWIGMNSVILPGVRLGPNTIVGAGSVVTKSFELGNIVIVGNPAKPLRGI